MSTANQCCRVPCILEGEVPGFHTLLLAGVTARVVLYRINSFLSLLLPSVFANRSAGLPTPEVYIKTPADRLFRIAIQARYAVLLIGFCGCLDPVQVLIKTRAKTDHQSHNWSLFRSPFDPKKRGSPGGGSRDGTEAGSRMLI
jgi:hypothetical protein